MNATPKPTRRSPVSYRHPVNQALYGAPPTGARIADAVTTFIGSWKFLAEIRRSGAQPAE